MFAGQLAEGCEILRRLHERKLLRLQQEEEAELVAQRERELELQVALASLVLQLAAMYGCMWSSPRLTQTAHFARSPLIYFRLPYKSLNSYSQLKSIIPIAMQHRSALKAQGGAAGDGQAEAVGAAGDRHSGRDSG